MQTYRLKKNPEVIVEAEQLTVDNVDTLANWCQGQIVEEGKTKGSMYEAINVKTPNGKERLHPGMYLMKFGGQFYTMASVNFDMRYDTIGLESPTATLTDDPWKGIPRIKDTP